MWLTANKVMCWILPGALMRPGSWDTAVGPNLVRRGHRAPCPLTPWGSPLCRAASPTRAHLWKAASGFPGSSCTVWRRTAWSSLVSPVGLLQSPYMIFAQRRTHSSQRLRSQQARTALFPPHNHKPRGDWIFVPSSIHEPIWLLLFWCAKFHNVKCYQTKMIPEKGLCWQEKKKA